MIPWHPCGDPDPDTAPDLGAVRAGLEWPAEVTVDGPPSLRRFLYVRGRVYPSGIDPIDVEQGTKEDTWWR